MFSMKKYQETISLIFYKHGVMCSTYPSAYIFGVIVAFLMVCYPLTTMPFHGNAPLEFLTPLDGYKVPLSQVDLEHPELVNTQAPQWYFDKPVSYLLQMVVKSAAHPSLLGQEGMKSSLEFMFELLDHVDAFRFQDGNETVSMTDLCLRVSEATQMDGLENFLPQYNCLFLSPARLWGQDKNKFLQDPDLVFTIFKKHKHVEYFTTMQDLLFGVPSISKKNLLKNGKPLLCAFTFALKIYNPRFIQALHRHLIELYPMKIIPKALNSDESSSLKVDHLVHIHYQSNNNFFVEYIPLIFAYVVLCLYLYFSVRKIEMVKSKWGLALSAMVTLIASLFMSLSLCVFVGLTPSLNGSEIFPYLVVIIGLENILVITKSVVSTPVHLDVKLRIALGLQKEGWYIFKNLLTELLILAIGFFTFVPAIQEFCLFAILGLGSDFFLQMFFFTTVLSIDIRRMELTDLHGSKAVRHDRLKQDGRDPLSQKLNSYDPITHTLSSSNDISVDSFIIYEDDKIPKRVRLIHIWARYRVLQRAMMVFVILWIALVVCKTTIFDEDAAIISSDTDPNATFEFPKLIRNFNNISSVLLNDKKTFIESPFRSSLLHGDLELWKQLPFNHWKNLFDFYNISLLGRYLTILPSIHLSIGYIDEIPLSEDEILLNEFNQLKVWKSLENYSSSTWHNQTPISFIDKLVRYPRSTAELVLTVLLGIFSFVLLSCCIFLLYKCLCSRRYAKWRSSWRWRSSKSYNNDRNNLKYYKQIKETIPLMLIGHNQEVECVCLDGRLLASSCLGGEVRIWDSETGECLSVIDRHCRVMYRPEMAIKSSPSHQKYLSSSSTLDCFEVEFFCEKKSNKNRNKTLNTSLSSIFPDLTETIETDFKNTERISEIKSGIEKPNSLSSTGFDFTKFQLYFEKQKKMNEEKERLKEKKREEEEIRIKMNFREENSSHETEDEFVAGSAIWCLAFKNNMAVLGCGSGDIEFWDVHSPALIGCCQKNNYGVTAICLTGNRLIASRVDGTLDFFSLQRNSEQCWNQETSSQDTVQCLHLWTTRAHRLTINCLETDDVRVLTASQDHMIKVHRIEDHACLFTLIGHTNCVTTLLFNKVEGLVVSGSSDSSLRLWEVRTGSCLHKLVGHQSTITCIAYDNYLKRLYSVAMDDRLCVWNASRGHLLHCVQMEAGCCNAVAVLNSQVILTGGLGCIYLWDVETCTVVRTLNLSDRISSVFIRQLLTSDKQLIVTDYGTQLRIIKFNSVLEKHD